MQNTALATEEVIIIMLLWATVLRNQAGTLVEKPGSTRRSWWIGDLVNTGGLRGDRFSKDLSPE